MSENNNILDIESEIKDNNIIISSKNSYYKEPFYTELFPNEKDFSTFVKAAEKVVRNSKEYKAYIGNLKEIGLTNCAILNNIDDEKAEIEFHHYPFTLYDIVSVVIDKRLDNNQPVSTFLVANEVMNLHFQNKVGLVPLSETVHQLVHDGEIFINYNQVFGYFDKFVEDYNKYLYSIDMETYNKLLASSQRNVKYSNNDILEY
jgi:hypothetical protein